LSIRWLDNWRGVGLLAVGLHRTGYDLDLRQYGDGHWRASFYVTGFAHSILGGSGWEPTVWRAVQRAGWDASDRASVEIQRQIPRVRPVELLLVTTNLHTARHALVILAARAAEHATQHNGLHRQLTEGDSYNPCDVEEMGIDMSQIAARA